MKLDECWTCTLIDVLDGSTRWRSGHKSWYASLTRAVVPRWQGCHLADLELFLLIICACERCARYSTMANVSCDRCLIDCWITMNFLSLRDLVTVGSPNVDCLWFGFDDVASLTEAVLLELSGGHDRLLHGFKALVVLIPQSYHLALQAYFVGFGARGGTRLIVQLIVHIWE